MFAYNCSTLTKYAQKKNKNLSSHSSYSEANFKLKFGQIIHFAASVLRKRFLFFFSFQFSAVTVIQKTQLNTTDLCNYILGCNSIDNPLMLWDITLPDTPKPRLKPQKRPKVKVVFFILYNMKIF
jgi:hypothetical protein